MAVAKAMSNFRRSDHAQYGLHLAVHSAPYAMILANHEGRIALVNSLAERLFGYASDELTGQPFELLFAAPFRKNDQVLPNGVCPRPEPLTSGVKRRYLARHKDGRQFPVEVGLHPVELDDGTWFLRPITDISGSQLPEESFRLVVERAPTAMVIVNH